MGNYECREQLRNTHLVLHSFHRDQEDLNQCNRASVGGWSKNLKPSKDYLAIRNNQVITSSNSAVLKGLEDVKGCLASSSDTVRIAALTEALKYGEDGFKLVAKIVKTERGLVQLTAIDLLWQNVNTRGKQKLLQYLSRHPEVCANYIEKVLEPSLNTMQEEQEQRRQALAQVCQTQELIRQQYTQALSRASLWEIGDRDSTIPINLVEVKQDKQTLTDSKLNTHHSKTSISALVQDNPDNHVSSDQISAKALLQDTIALKAQLDQQTDLVKNLLPDLVLISKLFEAKAKKHLVEAQIFVKAVQQIEKALFQIEAHWQDLESITDDEKSPMIFLELLNSLILEMQEHLMLLNQTVARAITTQLQIQHHYNLAKQAANYCQHRAQLDWQEGDENWARETLVRRKTYLDTAIILKSSLEQQTSQLETFKCHLFVLQAWLSLARQMKNTLKGDRSSASTQEAHKLLLQRIEFPYNTSSIMAQLERIKQECYG